MSSGEEPRQLPPISGPGGGDPSAAQGPPEIEGYSVLGPLGTGGMGTVWRAVQQSTRREVALKVLACGALASDKARVRFEREVELAARLEHPHIARVYDSGLYHGQYYYAMERVDGLPLDEYAEKAGLAAPAILRLMLMVCRAVQHAHQRGVLHRDLKPSNVLVSAQGQPHVLDFGLAKALREDDTALAISEGGDIVGTPAYMAPEQAVGRTDLLDTRSDVYSLGVILYRLLTGEFPHRMDGTRFEVLRRIAEEDPRRPRDVAGADFNPELEALLLKALAHDPEGRYASAGELADDLARFLAGEPLSAKRPTLLYFLGKRLRRHRAAVVVALTVVVAFAIMATSFYVRLGHERDRAQHEADKVTAVMQFFDESLAPIDLTETYGRKVTMVDVLERAESRIATRFAGQPLLEAEVRHSLGGRYAALGELEAAERNLALALELRRRLQGEDSPDALSTQHLLANILRRRGRHQEAEEQHRQVLEVRRRLWGPDSLDTLESMNDLAKVLADQQRYREAEGLQRRAVDASRRVQGTGSPHTLAFMADLATTLWEHGDRSGAEALYRQVLQLRREALGDSHYDTVCSRMDLANALWNQGRRAEALPLYTQVVEAQERLLGEAHPVTLGSMRALANALTELGRHGEAAPLRSRELALRQHLSEEELLATLVTMNDLANELQRLGRYVEAGDLHGEVLRTRERILGRADPQTLSARNNLAMDLYWQGRLKEAETLHREVLQDRERILGAEHPDTLRSKNNLGSVLYGLGRYGEAERLHREALEVGRRVLGERHPDTVLTMHNLAEALLGRGACSEAAALFAQVFDAHREWLGEQHPKTQAAQKRLAAALAAQEKAAQSSARPPGPPGGSSAGPDSGKR